MKCADPFSGYCLQLIFDPAPVKVFGCAYPTPCWCKSRRAFIALGKKKKKLFFSFGIQGNKTVDSLTKSGLKANHIELAIPISKAETKVLYGTKLGHNGIG